MRLPARQARPSLSRQRLTHAWRFSSLAEEARSKYDRLKNAPSDEERRDQLIRELKMEVQAKIKQDLKYAVSRASSRPR